MRIELPDDAVEMDITLNLTGANAVRLALQQADNTEVSSIEWRDQALCVPGVDPVPLPPVDDKVRLRVYLDRSVIEIFAHNGERWATNLKAPGEHPVLTATTDGAASIASLDVWRMKSIW
jgi:sucrose-6-phosphate hydrolase SacC (GH32 family)